MGGPNPELFGKAFIPVTAWHHSVTCTLVLEKMSLYVTHPQKNKFGGPSWVFSSASVLGLSVAISERGLITLPTLVTTLGPKTKDLLGWPLINRFSSGSPLRLLPVNICAMPLAG